MGVRGPENDGSVGKSGVLPVKRLLLWPSLSNVPTDSNVSTIHNLDHTYLNSIQTLWEFGFGKEIDISDKNLSIESIIKYRFPNGKRHIYFKISTLKTNPNVIVVVGLSSVRYIGKNFLLLR